MYGLTLGYTNCWGIDPENVNHAEFHHIHFTQDGSKANQGGIQVCGPSTDVHVHHLTGYFTDDPLCADAFSGRIDTLNRKVGRGDGGRCDFHQ